MKFISKPVDHSVNVSKEKSLNEFFKLLIGLFVFFTIGYFVLSFVIDIVVWNLPKSFENKLSNLFLDKLSLSPEQTENEIKVQKVLEKLLKNIDFQGQYKIHIIKASQINAFAIIGGNIIVTDKLLKNTKSENELAMVLAHELGHYKNRDHLRKFGRSLVLSLFLSLVSNKNSIIDNIVLKNPLNPNIFYSKKQEYAADSYGLELLNKTYDHVAGSTDFFKHFLNKESSFSNALFNKSHPAAEKRIKKIKEITSKKSFSIKKKIKFNFSY